MRICKLIRWEKEKEKYGFVQNAYLGKSLIFKVHIYERGYPEGCVLHPKYTYYRYLPEDPDIIIYAEDMIFKTIKKAKQKVEELTKDWLDKANLQVKS